MDDVDDAESAAAQGAENRDGGHGPQDEFEVEVVADVRAVVRFADGHGEDRVGDHPRDDHVGAHRPVVVLLLLRFADAFGHDFEPVAEVAEGLVVAGINVQLLRGHLQLDGVALPGDGGPEVDVDHVVAFGAPGHVVRVAKGVDLQRADVRREEREVLRG